MRFLPAQAFNLITYTYNEPEVVNILKTMFKPHESTKVKLHNEGAWWPGTYRTWNSFHSCFLPYAYCLCSVSYTRNTYTATTSDLWGWRMLLIPCILYLNWSCPSSPPFNRPPNRGVQRCLRVMCTGLLNKWKTTDRQGGKEATRILQPLLALQSLLQTNPGISVASGGYCYSQAEVFKCTSLTLHDTSQGCNAYYSAIAFSLRILSRHSSSLTVELWFCGLCREPCTPHSTGKDGH